MMTAANARKTVEECKSNKQRDQLAKIEDSINKAVISGEFSCYVYFAIDVNVRKQIEELGYKVGPSDFDRNETLTPINW